MTTTLRPTRLHLFTETLRFLATASKVDASRGRPCLTQQCSEGPPCTGSVETCPRATMRKDRR